MYLVYIVLLYVFAYLDWLFRCDLLVCSDCNAEVGFTIVVVEAHFTW